MSIPAGLGFPVLTNGGSSRATSTVDMAMFSRVLQSGARNICGLIRVQHVSNNAHRSDLTDDALKDHYTSFGFQNVSADEKTEKVYQVFKTVADKYDLMNDVMSWGVHRLWKDRLISVLGPVPGMQLIDVAGGTGDISVRFLQAIRYQLLTGGDEQTPREGEVGRRKTEAHVVDINSDMLQAGKKHRGSIFPELCWTQANAEELPYPDCSFDVYTIGFGIRNVTHIDKALSEAYRVLRPGGRFLCLEFSHVGNPLIKSIYDSYSFRVIPVMGLVLVGDWHSYMYLVESIRKFPNQELFKDMILEAGFRNVTYENLTGGIAAIHSGFKF